MDGTSVARSALASRPARSATLALVILCGLNFVDEFDRAAFGTLVPEIRDALSMSDAGILTLASLVGAIAILLAVPIGYLADRRDRVWVTVAAGVLLAAASLTTGLTTTVAVLASARLASWIANDVSEGIHPSLLSSIYPIGSLPLVTATHRSLGTIGALLAGPLAGFAAVHAGWRSPFLIIAGPALVLALLAAARLRDPRGPGEPTSSERPANFLQAFQELRGTKAIRRLWIAAPIFGAGIIPFLSGLIGLFFEDRFALGPEARGSIVGLHGVMGLIGLFLAGRLSRDAARERRPQTLMRLMAGFVLFFGAGLMLLASMPILWLAVGLAILIAVGSAGNIPPYTALLALITRPSVRSQAFMYSLTLIGTGGILASLFIGTVAARIGIGGTTAILGGLVGLSGLIIMSGARHAVAVADDTDAQPARE